MTLTDVIPSLRRTLPSPFRADLWPAQTEVSPTDVCLAAVSMVRFAELCGTPCVHGARAVIPGTGGRLSPQGECSIVVTAVLSVADGCVQLDAELGSVPTEWVEARLIGRASTAHRHPMRLVGPSGEGAAVAELPADTRAGDLIAIPCARLVVHRDLIASGPAEVTA